MLLTGLPQVDEGEDQGEEDDDEGAQEESHHHPLSVGLLTHSGTLSTHLLRLVLDTAPPGNGITKRRIDTIIQIF